MYSIYDSINNEKDKSYSISQEKIKLLSEGGLTGNEVKELINSLVNRKIELFMKRIMKEQFDKFVGATMGIWDSMTVGEMRKLDKTTIHGVAAKMFEYPFNIAYFFKQEGTGEGPTYVFLNKEADKVYSVSTTLFKSQIEGHIH